MSNTSLQPACCPTNHPRSKGLFLLSFVAMLLLSGCYQRIQDGGQIEFSYELSSCLGVLLLGLILFPLGIMLRRSHGGFAARFGLGLTIMGSFLLITAPMMKFDRITLTDTSFETRGVIQVEQVKFTEVREARILVTPRLKGQSDVTLLLQLTDGSQKSFYVRELMRNYFEEILSTFEKKGIPVRPGPIK